MIRMNVTNKLERAAKDTSLSLGKLEIVHSERFRHPDEARRLANVLASFCDNPLDADLAISELLINAIEHGNLSIGSKLKTQLLQSGTYAEELNRRLVASPWASRSAHATFLRGAGSLLLIIVDEGDGFDTESVPQDADIALPNGRGIQLARSIFFNEVSYNVKGNACLAIRRCLS